MQELALWPRVPDCERVRTWFVIPAMGIVTGSAALALGMSPVFALAGAALAAAVRGLAGDAPAALVAAAVAPLLAASSLAELGAGSVHASIALAAAGWAISELSRGREAPGSPLVAVLPAAVAAALDPSFVALVLVAGARVVSAPGPRPRWALAIPAAGGLAIVLAALGGTVWPELGARWFGAAAHPVAPRELAVLAGSALGPLTAVAALAGSVVLARPRLAELAVAVACGGAILVDLRAGALGPASIGLAALLAALAVGRLAAMIRVSPGQAIAGATAGALVIAAPAWAAFDHRLSAAHTGRASR